MAAGMAFALAAMVANAQAPDTGFYVGGSIGQSQIRFDDSTLEVAGASSTSISKDETDTAWKAFLGYRLGKYLAVEGGYMDLGKFSATNTVTAPANGSLTVSFKASGPFVDAVGILPLGNGNFSLFGKAGVMYSTAKGSATATGAVVTTGNADQSSSEFNLKAGIGAGYDFTRNFGVRVELEQVFAVGDKDKTGEGDIRLLTLGGVFRF
jgi:OOP family OmpA-OmpF porin